MVLGECCPWDWYVPFGSTLLTLGISDAFAGGFVAGIVEGKSLDESIDMGHWLASLSIKELGPQYVHSLLAHISSFYQSWQTHQATASKINASSTFVTLLASFSDNLGRSALSS